MSTTPPGQSTTSRLVATCIITLLQSRTRGEPSARLSYMHVATTKTLTGLGGGGN